MPGRIIAVLTVIILSVVALASIRDLRAPSPVGNTTEEIPATLADNNRVAVTHAFQDGIHRYTGTFLLPHTCFSVDQLATYTGEKISIAFSVRDILSTEETCLRIKTRYPFSLIVEAPEETPAEFILNDEEVPATIRELKWQSAAGTLIDDSVTPFP